MIKRRIPTKLVMFCEVMDTPVSFQRCLRYEQNKKNILVRNVTLRVLLLHNLHITTNQVIELSAQQRNVTTFISLSYTRGAMFSSTSITSLRLSLLISSHTLPLTTQFI